MLEELPVKVEAAYMSVALSLFEGSATKSWFIIYEEDKVELAFAFNDAVLETGAWSESEAKATASKPAVVPTKILFFAIAICFTVEILLT